MNDRVELQREIDANREGVFHLVSSGAGRREWLDDGEIEARVGGAVRLRLRDSDAVGKILAIDPPQHISFTWQWAGESAASGVVAFDAIDHGARTHLTLRHVGLRSAEQVQMYEELWRFWMEALIAAARALPDDPGRTASFDW
jgi:uncharacterized protein YndB with AHSA1/START domain